MKRNNFIGLNLHGEAAEVDEEQQLLAIDDFWRRVQEKIESLNIPQSWVYNTDQTGLFYQKLPNRLYADKDATRSTCGVKQMKSKE